MKFIVWMLTILLVIVSITLILEGQDLDVSTVVLEDSWEKTKIEKTILEINYMTYQYNINLERLQARLEQEKLEAFKKAGLSEDEWEFDFNTKTFNKR